MRSAELATALRQAERWLLPAECLLCQGPATDATGDALVCRLCQSRFHRLPEPQCPRCGQPTAGLTDPCRVCSSWPAGFGPVRSAVWLDPLARAAVHHLKYGGWWRVAAALAPIMAPLIRARQAATLVPIPLADRRA